MATYPKINRLWLSGVLGMMLAGRAWAADSDYINFGTVDSFPSPQIDATNFINYGTFTTFSGGVLVTNGGAAVSGLPYDFTSVEHFTNFNQMSCTIGFRFDTVPESNGLRHAAATFFNAGAVNPANAGIYGFSYLDIFATNVFNRGALTAEPVGELLVQANGPKGSVDIGRSHLKVFSTTVDGTGVAASAPQDNYWGAGNTNQIVPDANFALPTPTSPPHTVTNVTAAGLFVFDQILSLNNVIPYQYHIDSGNGTQSVQVVLIGTPFPDPNITTDVRFAGNTARRPGTAVVQWQSIVPNPVTGQEVTNFLYLTDNFPANTNTLHTNSLEFGFTTFKPSNFVFSSFAPPGFITGLPANSTYDPTLLAGDVSPITNIWSAYSVVLPFIPRLPISVGAFWTNFAGRIKLIADHSLDLTHTRIEGYNYMLLSATNHFVVGDTKAMSIITDLNLGTTNGNLSFPGVLSSYVPKLNGEIDLYSAKWTNSLTTASGTNSTGGTNFSTNFFSYHVLMVNSALQSTAATYVGDLHLRSTNVVIDDPLTILNSLLIDADQLTIQSTGGLTAPFVNAAAVNWSNAAPFLRNLTNNGYISGFNPASFVGNTRGPNPVAVPYASFVNHGTIFSTANLIWANYFENSGLNGAYITSSSGPLTIHAQTAVLSPFSLLSAPNEDISITASNLTINFSQLSAGRSLTLAVTNNLTDGSTNSGNFWSCGNGFNLLTKPASGDLTGTTVSITAFDFADVFSQWAAEDRGPVPAGFLNNASLGKLILDGGDTSLFEFAGTGPGNNALYVDFLDLRNSAAVFDANTNLTGVQIDPGMKIYFAQAVGNGSDITSMLNGANGGQFGQVTNYPVYFSMSGSKLSLSSQEIGLKVVVTNAPAPAALVSWNSVANSTNFLYFKDGMGPSDWQLLTNFVFSPVSGPVTVADPVKPSAPRYYRVRVDLKQP